MIAVGIDVSKGKSTVPAVGEGRSDSLRESGNGNRNPDKWRKPNGLSEVGLSHSSERSRSVSLTS